MPITMGFIKVYVRQERRPDILFRATNADGKYPAFAWNGYKDMFTCTAKFNAPEEELAIIWSHFVFAASAIVFILCSILWCIGQVYVVQSSTRKNARRETRGRERITSPKGFVSSLMAFKKAMDKYGATKLTLLGFSAFVLVVILLITIFNTFPQVQPPVNSRFFVYYIMGVIPVFVDGCIFEPS